MIIKRSISTLIVIALVMAMVPVIQAAPPGDGIYVNNSYDDGKNNTLPAMSNFQAYNTGTGASAMVTGSPSGSKPGKVLAVTTLASDTYKNPNINYDFSASNRAGIIYASAVPVLVMEMNIRIENTGIRRTLFGLRDNLDYLAPLAVIDSGFFKLCTNTGSPLSVITECVPDRWYHVMAKVDMENRTYDFYIDGLQVLKNKEIYALTTTEGAKGLFNKSLKFIRMEHNDNYFVDGKDVALGGATYFDDFKVYALGAQTAPSVSAVTDLSQTSYLAESLDFKFSSAMDKRFLNSDEITVVKSADGTVVPYTVEIADAFYYRMVFGANTFESETAYTINFSDKVTDLFGNTLGEGFSLDMYAKNSPPAVAVTFAAGEKLIKAGSDFTLTATAVDIETSVEAVAFYRGDTKIGDAVLSDGVYTYRWTNLPEGRHEIYAEAVDTGGVRGRSEKVTLNVVLMNPIIETDFNNATGWIPYANNGTVGIVPDPMGLYGTSMRLNVTAGVEGNPNANRDFTSSPYTGLIYYSFRVLPKLGLDSGVEIKDTGNISSLLVKFSSSGELRNAQDAAIGTYIPGQWLDIRVIWDTSSTAYTLWVNGTEYAMQLKNTVTSMSYFRIYAWGPRTLTSDTSTYFDSIYIYNVVRRPDVSQVSFKDGDGNITSDKSNVGINLQSLLLTFADRMDASTITTENITLSKGSNNTPVVTRGKYDAATKTYTMILLEMPERLSTYYITINKSVKTSEKMTPLNNITISYTMADAPIYAEITGYKVGGKSITSSAQLGAGDVLQINGVITNNSNAIQKAALIAAVFKNGEIIHAGYTQENLLATEKQKPTSVTLTLPAGYTSGCSVMAFMWDSIRGMTPLSAVNVLP